MILELIHWIFGYISFEIYSDAPEKIVNMAVKDRYNLWDIKISNETLKAKMIYSEYKKMLSNIGSKTQPFWYQINSEIVVGFPIFIKKHKKRIGFLIGIFLFVSIVKILSLYVWNINVSGCNNLNNEYVINVLKELDVYPGKKISSINIPFANQGLMDKIDDIAWVSINIKGSNLEVNIKEKTNKPDIITPDVPCNIIAKKDAQIYRVETYEGNSVVKPNEVVFKGQILVSGIVESPNIMENRFVHSRAKVFAKTNITITKTVPRIQQKLGETGRIKRQYGITIFGKEIPIWFYHKNIKNYKIEKQCHNIWLFNAQVPIGYYKHILYEQKLSETEFDENQAKNILKESIEKEIESKLAKNDIEILNCQLSDIKEISGEYVMSADYECVEEISEEERIIFDE